MTYTIQFTMKGHEEGELWNTSQYSTLIEAIGEYDTLANRNANPVILDEDGFIVPSSEIDSARINVSKKVKAIVQKSGKGYSVMYDGNELDWFPNNCKEAAVFSRDFINFAVSFFTFDMSVTEWYRTKGNALASNARTSILISL